MNIQTAITPTQKPPFRKVNWLPREIDIDRRADGVVVLKSRIPLMAYETHIPASLAKWAGSHPDRVWLAQRGTDREWRKVSYGEAKRTVDALTQALLDLDLPEGAPVAVLSGNSIEHALMTQSRDAGAFCRPRLLSPAYSLMSEDHAKLKYLFGLIKPVRRDGAGWSDVLRKALHALDLDRRNGDPCRPTLRTGIAERRFRPIGEDACHERGRSLRLQ